MSGSAIRQRLTVLAMAGWLVAPAYGQYCGVAGGAGAYLNARYGFELDYAGGWHRLRVGPREDEFQWVCRDTLVVEGVILDLEHIEFSGERTHADSLWRAITHKTTLFCAADGVDGGSHCEGPVDVREFRTVSGLPALEFYQTYIYEDYAAGTSKKHHVGPYFAVDISQQGETRALVLTPGSLHGASERWADFVEGMVNGVRRVESPFLRKRRPIVVPLRR